MKCGVAVMSVYKGMDGTMLDNDNTFHRCNGDVQSLKVHDALDTKNTFDLDLSDI